MGDKKFRLNFYWQILSLLAGGTLAVAVIGSLTTSILVNQNLSDLVSTQARQLTSSFAQQSILPLLSGIGQSAENEINSVQRYPNVKHVGIYNNEGDLLVGTPGIEHHLSNFPLVEMARPFEVVLINENENDWIFSAPVYDSEDTRKSLTEQSDSIIALFSENPRLLGYVSLVIDRSELKIVKQELLGMNMLTTVAIALVIVTLAVVFIRKLLLPLYSFIGTMEKAEAGGDVRAEISGPLEIQRMARGFNTMMQALEQRRLYAEEQHMFLLSEIREREQAEVSLKQSESHLRDLLAKNEAIVSTVPGIIAEVDRQGRTLWWNKRLERVTGLGKDEIANMNAIELFPPEVAVHVRNQIGECFLKGKSELHTDLLTSNGPVPYQFVSVRINDISGKPENSTVLSIGMDGSETVAVQKALQEARDSAVESSHTKSEFMANMSHEIRTPMNGILGMLQLLADSKMSVEQKSYVDIALRSADHLLSFINDVLDFSKIESGKLVITNSDVSPRDLIEDVVELFATQAHEKGLKIYADISFEIPDLISIDPYRLKQIVSNLVNNAIKFTEEGYVLVKARIDHEILCIDVVDTGVGIAPEVQERVFESFSQADGSTTRRYGGTGLGLAIVRQLSQLMGGNVTLQSDGKNGSVFSVTLPIARPLSHSQIKPRFNAAGADWKIYYIGDDTVQAGILSSYAYQLKLEFRHISGMEASHPVRDNKHHLYLVDESHFNEFSSKNSWIMKCGDNVIIVIMHRTKSSLENIPDECASLTKLITPVRFASFSRLLLQQEHSPGREDKVSDYLPRRSNDKILVVEDNDVNRHVIVSMLKKFGYDPIIVRNGKEAVEEMEKNDKISLVFMDVQMPLMDGYQATRIIRKRDAGNRKRPMIIAMTGNAMRGDREKCLKAGMDDYITKPIRLAFIRDALYRWAEQK